MGVLSREEVLKAIESKEIAITPYNPKNLGPASLDLTLSSEFRLYKPGMGVIDIHDDTDYKEFTTLHTVQTGKGFLLPPGQTCLAITNETVSLSPKICGLLEGRSRFARCGLFVHISASFMQPGISNRQVLEIYNASPNPLNLFPGTRICQFIFMTMEGEATYQGKFTNQDL